MRRGVGSGEYDPGDEPCEIDCKVLRRTPNGVLIRTAENEEIWLPREYTEKIDNGVKIPEWLARDRGLI